ncbi:hypothetical protein KP509_13G010300 [Ceratopteris richardii]|nr:hypothetical protein KP509_13G010300 [Ceratopteris richardii]
MLIKAYAKSGMSFHAFSVYKKMQEDSSFHPAESTYTALLKLCTKSKNLEVGLRIHGELDRRGLLSKNVFLGSALVDLYGKCGLLNRAQDIFNRMSVQNVVSWTTLMTMYVDHGNGDEALKCLKQMQSQGISPTSVTLMCGLKACAILKDLEQGQELHAELERRELQKDQTVGNTLVDMYVKSGDLILAKEVFDRLPVQDVVSWTALIAGYVDHGHAEEALCCFEQMQLEGVTPNAVTVVFSLKACGSTCSITKGREIHAEIERQQLQKKNPVVGNALVDMYARCGLLARAREVCKQLPVRGVIAWTALISRYVEHGHGDEALECYNEMQAEGQIPNLVTLVCALNACSMAGAAEKGREIHCEIERRGFADDEFGCKSLIEMYGEFGFLDTATEVFERLKFHSLDLWNALMWVYLENGHEEGTLHWFEALQLEGLSLDEFSFSCCFKACGGIYAIDKGQEMHCEVERRNLLHGDLVLGNALVDMYAKSGLVRLAEEVFDKLPNQNVFSWTALIAGYAEHGQGEEALKCFDSLQLSGIAPEASTYVCVLKACGSIQAEDKGREIHVEVERQDLIKQNMIIGNALIDMYVKCGLLTTAGEVFNNLPARDNISWTTLIMGYAEHGRAEDALECFRQMQLNGFFSDTVSLISGLKVSSNIKATELGQDIHNMIKEHELLNQDLVIGSSLIDMYAKNGSISHAEEVFANLPLRDQVTWNALIGGYVDHGNSEETVRCFKQMQLEGLLPNEITFLKALKACAIAHALQEGLRLHVQIENERLSENNIYVGSSLIDMYTKCGSFDSARLVLEKLPIPNVVSWTALIAGYEEHGLSEEALECYDTMQLKGAFLNAITYVAALKACGNIGAIERGFEIHAEVERRDLLNGDLVIANALIDMYAKCGSMIKAQRVFDALTHRDVVSWTTLLTGYAQLGENGHVLYNFNRMIADGVVPNSVTFAVVLSSCNRAGLLEESYMLLEVMSKEYDIFPSIEHFTWVIDAYGRSGKIDKAVDMIQNMPFCPNPSIWHAVLVACEKGGTVKFGKQTFEQSMLSDIKNAEMYKPHIFVSCETLGASEQI